ncbi:MAG: argininosuccinate lyase [Phycisphaerae bacterium]|nr:argininosuccinate lyase [Phycisphaerae bacterium]
MALWGGRFKDAADPLFREVNDSLPFDYRLAREDIVGSMAWARALERAKVLTTDERRRLEAALADLLALVTDDPEEPIRDAGSDEDIHSWVERRLIAAVGDLGKKLHTGRSRNDQVATGLRLWTRGAIDARLAEVRSAQASLVRLARREQPAVLCGYTHLQRAQPLLFAHWCLAYVEMLERDAARLGDARRRVNVCPLGSAALAGTTFAVDRAALAADLGFDAPSANSLDATADRDFAIETLSALSTLAVHLSRLGEDLILYSSQEFGFVELHDSVSSGSSLMPQKKNPDALELLRGKAGRVIGAHVGLMVACKGLPLAYNKDLQEDKEPLFDAMDQASLCLRILARVADTLKLNRERLLNAARGGHTNATELADYLVSKGVPFRDAHDIVGRAVREAIGAGKRLDELPLDSLRKFSDRIGPDVAGWLTVESCLARREIPGGTGPRAVDAALAAAERRLGLA